MKRLGLRGQVFLAMVGLVLGVVIALVAVFNLDTRAHLERRMIESMEREAAAVEIAAVGVAPTTTALDALADEVSVGLGARVTFVAADGRVLGDSQVGAERIATLENHAGRPEIVAARRGGHGSARRVSATVGMDLFYVALGFEHPRGGPMVVRLSRGAEFLDAEVRRFTGFTLLATLVAIIAAAILAGYVASALSRRLRGLAGRVGLAVTGDEVSGLAGSFDRLSERLDRKVSELAATRDRLSTLLESLGEAVIAVDEERRITMANSRALRLLGLGEDPVGQPLLSVIRDSTLVDVLSTAAAGEPAHAEFAFQRADEARPRIVATVAAPLTEGGGVVLVARDVTQVRHLETMRRDFVANVSHELRTPVAVIRGSGETLETLADEMPPEAAPFVEKITRTADRMSALISDLLDLSRVEEKQVQAADEPVDIVAFLQSVAEQARVRGLVGVDEVVVRVPEACVARADPRALEQIMWNLLENAVKYGSSDAGPIVLSGTRVGGAVEIAVEDRGPGIPVEARDRVFERFYRVDAGRSRDMGGTGLGLSIVRRLAESMAGRVGLDPIEPHGCRFWVRLPSA